MYIYTHIRFGRLGNALQLVGTSATLGWNQRFKVPSSVCFYKMLDESPMAFYLLTIFLLCTCMPSAYHQ